MPVLAAEVTGKSKSRLAEPETTACLKPCLTISIFSWLEKLPDKIPEKSCSNPKYTFGERIRNIWFGATDVPWKWIAYPGLALTITGFAYSWIPKSDKTEEEVPYGELLTIGTYTTYEVTNAINDDVEYIIRISAFSDSDRGNNPDEQNVDEYGQLYEIVITNLGTNEYDRTEKKLSSKTSRLMISQAPKGTAGFDNNGKREYFLRPTTRIEDDEITIYTDLEYVRFLKRKEHESQDAKTE